MGRGPGRPVKTPVRAGPSKHVGRLIGRMDVVLVVAVVHYVSLNAAGTPAGTPACETKYAASWAGRSGPYRAHI